jgi:hypothetical protein
MRDAVGSVFISPSGNDVYAAPGEELHATILSTLGFPENATSEDAIKDGWVRAIVTPDTVYVDGIKNQATADAARSLIAAHGKGSTISIDLRDKRGDKVTHNKQNMSPGAALRFLGFE